MSDEPFVTALGMRMCKGDACKGRIFGGWQRCPHGLIGRVNELVAELTPLTAELSQADWPDPVHYRSDDVLFK